MSEVSIRVAGVGVEPFTKRSERPIAAMGVNAVVEALKDSVIDRERVDALFVGHVFGGSLLGQQVAKDVGLDGLPIFNHENACASGGFALAHAVMALRAGLYSTVVVLGIEKLSALGGGLLPVGQDDPEILAGLTMPASYALRAASYFDRFGGSPEDLANVAVKSRQRAVGNPLAMFRKETTLEDVMDARTIAGAITLFQMSPNADGAAAVLLTTAPDVGDSSRPPVHITASQVASGRFYQGERDLTWPDITLRAAQAAYAEAQIEPGQVDVAEVHDAATVGEVIYYEALGFCERGAGLDLVRQMLHEPDNAPVQVNAGGGLLSRGHPLGATGVAQVSELTRQLEGRAWGLQVPDATVAVSHCTGGGVWGMDNGAASVHILTTGTG